MYYIDIIPQDILVFSIMIMSRYGCWFATYGTGTDTDTDYGGTEYKAQVPGVGTWNGIQNNK